MKTVKQITGIWLGKQARMVMILSVTHRKNILFPAQTPENAVGFVLAEHTNHPDVRAVACIGLTDGLAVRERTARMLSESPCSDANDLMSPADKASNIRINIRRTA